MSLQAAGKINLYLEIQGKRPDGYHDLRSLIAPVSLCDDLEFELTDGPIESQVTLDGLPLDGGSAVPHSADNLTTRAAELLREAAGCRTGARIRIRKRVPIGGGMGGGSADAAATLRGLNALWELGLPDDDLMRLGAALGSDVPALVAGGAVVLSGRGERIERVHAAWPRDAGGGWVVLANPGFGVSTRDAYRRFIPGLTPPSETFNNAKLAFEKGDWRMAAASLYNSLQASVFLKYPLLAMVAEALAAAGSAGVLLSGSGATVFALAASRADAEAIQRRVSAQLGAWLWLRVVKVLPDGVMVAHGPLEARV